jgi:aspartate kinase
MAATLNADRCEIYKDFDGVCTADPRVVPAARPIPRLSYELCSTLARSGANVLHARCVDLAALRGVRIEVRSAADPGEGTCIEEVEMEGGKVQAVVQRAHASIAIAEGNAGGRGEARGIIDAVHAAYPEVELLAHEEAGSGHAVLVWLCGREDADALVERFREIRGPGGEWRIQVEHDASFISAVGLGLTETHVTQAESALERAGVPLVALRVTPTSLVFRVPGAQGDAGLRALHSTFLETTD